MATLLLRCAGTQSWGTRSSFTERDGGTEPSKSGVVGMLACALGRQRGDGVDDLATLRMGVRVDRPGVVRNDFHTVMDVPQADFGRRTVITRRDYLDDALFLVGMEGGDMGFLVSLDAALRRPAHPVTLGRRSCLPTLPVAVGVREAALEEALRDEPLGPRALSPLRLVIERDQLGAGIQSRRDAIAPNTTFEIRRYVPRLVEIGAYIPEDRDRVCHDA